jgi:2-keto-4-pentenoate hydratase/2-oxohepta-3-ene-1,7-dioic acid hydratase in catechol pathway
MKIAQFYEGPGIRLGLVEGDSLIPLDFPGSMTDFIKGDRVIRRSGAPVRLQDVRLAPPVTEPSKIIAIGLNYMDHIEESKGTIPKVPIVFAKFPNTLVAHLAPIAWRQEITAKVDFEAELAVVMGKRIFSASREEVLAAVFGYTCANDVSARDLQFGDGQWVRGKSLDTFCPLGPWIVTADEIADPHDLEIRCVVNKEVMQQSNTGRMIFRLPELISFLSSHFTLLPGDLILTGTPHGVGAFRDPSIYLKDGDEVVVEIEGIGRLVNPCRSL